jgi:nucleotide-binding universal stress UspA family protein
VKTILCPTRGGEASYPNQDLAIQLAKERGSNVLFLYVSNIEFLEHFASPLLVDFETELEHIGDFILAMAQERAEKAGVTADTTCKRGNFIDALLDAIRENPIESVVLGSPAGDTAITTQSYLKDLIQSIMEKTSVEVLVVHEGEILEHYAQEK